MLKSAKRINEWLKTRSVIPIDASWHMPHTKRNAYQEYLHAHLPQARFFDIDKIADSSTGLPHMLPPVRLFEETMSLLGIRPSDDIVCYDASDVYSAFRLYYTLHVYGHEGKVYVLEGGLKKWSFETEHGHSEYPVRS